MTKQELYRDLCVEAGTCADKDVDADEWYLECSHNIHPDLDESLSAAAAGDVSALAECRQVCGLPIFA